MSPGDVHFRATPDRTLGDTQRVVPMTDMRAFGDHAEGLGDAVEAPHPAVWEA